MSLFRLILLFLIGYLIMRLISRIFGPKRRNASARQGYYTKEQRKEGEVIINSSEKNQEKKIKKDDGDYVDFEEL